MKLCSALAVFLSVVTPGLTTASSPAKEAQKASSSAKEARTIHVSAFDLPLSQFLGADTRAVLKRQANDLEELVRECPLKPADIVSPENIVVYRQCLEKYYFPALIARHTARYKVVIQPERIAGVATEVFTPVDGVSAGNRHRVLINLHGGAFMLSARWGGQVESIPIAALGRIRIVSVDYRMAPEHRFPAASEDIAAVYRALLVDYRAENIGVYGCSAGGLLAAQSVAWFLKEGLPTPGAIGMFCAGASFWSDGDSGYRSAAMKGGALIGSMQDNPYFRGTDPNDPLAFPVRSRQILAKFPPSLLISSTRDLALSSVVHTHSQLIQLGVEADLHVWEGVDHAFFYDPDLPQSREVYDVAVKFFDQHLGQH